MMYGFFLENNVLLKIYDKPYNNQILVKNSHLPVGWINIKLNWRKVFETPDCPNPGTSVKSKKASPAKSLERKKSWSITIKWTIPLGGIFDGMWLKFSYLILKIKIYNSKVSSKIGFKLLLITFVLAVGWEA